jgi:glycine cleavage system H protein
VPRQSKRRAKRPKGEERERAAALILRFSEDHVWVRVDGDRAQIGLSDRGQKTLGEIIAAELPEVGETIEQGEQFGELESTRTVQELVAPISGPVLAVNGEIEGSPALVNEDPYHDGWLIEVQVSNEGELDELMGAEEYDEFVDQDEPDE